MNNKLLYIFLIITTLLVAEELKVRADYFESDTSKGKSVFIGDVRVEKGSDELNATKLTIFTDEDKNPLKYIAEGDVVFKIKDANNKLYHGKAQKAVYLPAEKEYRFYKDVHLVQAGDKKDIRGDEVVFSVTTGKSYAKGAKDEPVIMVFDIKDKNKK